MILEKAIWIRVAVVKGPQSGKDARVWRFFPNRDFPEVNVKTWKLVGGATEHNVIPGENPAADGPMGLKAWIDLFGDLQIDDGWEATITLRESI